jgi:hypothetical protein
MAWAPNYITVEQLKNFARVDDDLDDVELSSAISAACRAIDGHCNRQFGKVDAPEEREYTARPNYERGLWIVDIDDLQDPTGLTIEVDGTTLTSGTYTLEPRNAVKRGKAFTRIAIHADAAAQPCGAVGEVVGLAPWGWQATPPTVVQASYLQSSRFASRRDSPYGVAGSPSTGSELRLLARVDPDVGVSLGDFRRTRRVG